jgi:hypothetical protein
MCNIAAALWCWLIGPLCRLLVLFNEAVSFSDRIASVIVNKLLWSIGLVVQTGENRSTQKKMPHYHFVNKKWDPDLRCERSVTNRLKFRPLIRPY